MFAVISAGAVETFPCLSELQLDAQISLYIQEEDGHTEWALHNVTVGIKKLDLTSHDRQQNKMSAFKEGLSGLTYILF